MALTSIGNYVFLAKVFEYNAHRIVCSFNVKPTAYGPEPIIDYHWMDDGRRWAVIECYLKRLLQSIDNWKNAKELKVLCMVDHINVTIKATAKPHPAAHCLMTGLKKDDLYLNIELQYNTCEDTVISSAICAATEENGIDKNISSSSSASTVKPSDANQGKPSQSKPKYKKDGDEEWIPPSANKINRVGGTSSQGSSLSSMRVIKTRSVSARRKAESPMEVKNLEKPVSLSALKKRMPPTSLSSMQAKVSKEQSGALKRKQTGGARCDLPPYDETLLLKHLDKDEVLATFHNYKPFFDVLFEERKSMKETFSYMNVTHMDIQDVLSTSIRDKMMQKLTKHYYSHKNHASLIISGILPFWIVLLFADTYDLSKRAAIMQIKYQKRESCYPKEEDIGKDPLAFDQDED